MADRVEEGDKRGDLSDALRLLRYRLENTAAGLRQAIDAKPAT